jgi:hypothetical protein
LSSFFSCFACVLTDGYRSVLKKENNTVKPTGMREVERAAAARPETPPLPSPPARRTTP